MLATAKCTADTGPATPKQVWPGTGVTWCHVVATRSHGIRSGRTRAGRGSRAGPRCPTADRGTAAGPDTAGTGRWSPAGSGPEVDGRAVTTAGSEGLGRRAKAVDDWTGRRTWTQRHLADVWDSGCKETAVTTGFHALSSTHHHHHHHHSLFYPR